MRKSSNEMPAIKYGIVAYRSNGERVYFVSSATQGETMVPYAASIATMFDTKKEAKKKMEIYLKVKWFGLTGWTVFQQI